MDAYSNDFKKTVLRWSFSLRYQLVHRYDVSYWSNFFTYQWDISETSQIGPSYWRTSWDLVMMSSIVKDFKIGN